MLKQKRTNNKKRKQGGPVTSTSQRLVPIVHTEGNNDDRSQLPITSQETQTSDCKKQSQDTEYNTPPP